MSMVATCALVALVFGESVLSPTPLMIPVLTAQRTDLIAHSDKSSMSVKPVSGVVSPIAVPTPLYLA